MVMDDWCRSLGSKGHANIFSESSCSACYKDNLIFELDYGVHCLWKIELLNSYDYAEAIPSDMEAIDHHILFLPCLLLQFLPLQVAHDRSKASRASKSLSNNLLDIVHLRS